MGSRVRVMHFADTHFGVELYGRLDPETGLNTRLTDFKTSLLRAIDRALQEGIDLALFAGDAYKARDPRQTDQREFADCIRKITDAGIPVVLLAGNHDMPVMHGRAHAVEIYRTLGVRNVHVLSRPEVICVDTPAGPVRIAGMPYLIKGYSIARDDFHGKTLDETKLLLEGKYVEMIRLLADEVRAAGSDGIPAILLGHFWVQGAQLSPWQSGYFTGTEPQVPLQSLVNPAFDYVALGHIHRQQDLHCAGQPHVVYSGSTDKIDFGERDDTKGFVLVDLSRGDTSFRFFPIEGSRPLVDIHVEVSEDDPTAQIVRAVKAHQLRGAIVRVSYALSHSQLGLVRDRDIRAALEPAFLVVAVNRKVERDAAARSRLLTETRSPREALEMYIDTRPELGARKELLLACAEPLFKKLSEEDALK